MSTHTPSATLDTYSDKPYRARSGTRFDPNEARSWLVERGLGSTTGRLTTEQIRAYAEAH